MNFSLILLMGCGTCEIILVVILSTIQFTNIIIVVKKSIRINIIL